MNNLLKQNYKKNEFRMYPSLCPKGVESVDKRKALYHDGLQKEAVRSECFGLSDLTLRLEGELERCQNSEKRDLKLLKKDVLEKVFQARSKKNVKFYSLYEIPKNANINISDFLESQKGYFSRTKKVLIDLVQQDCQNLINQYTSVLQTKSLHSFLEFVVTNPQLLSLVPLDILKNTFFDFLKYVGHGNFDLICFWLKKFCHLVFFSSDDKCGDYGKIILSGIVLKIKARSQDKFVYYRNINTANQIEADVKCVLLMLKLFDFLSKDNSVSPEFLLFGYSEQLIRYFVFGFVSVTSEALLSDVARFLIRLRCMNLSNKHLSCTSILEDIFDISRFSETTYYIGESLFARLNMLDRYLESFQKVEPCHYFIKNRPGFYIPLELEEQLRSCDEKWFASLNLSHPKLNESMLS
jgi:hypothetical protein